MLLRVIHPSYFVRLTDKLEQNQLESYPFLPQFRQISFANGILPELFTDICWMLSYNRKEDIYLYLTLAPSKMKKCKNTSIAVQNLYPHPPTPPKKQKWITFVYINIFRVNPQIQCFDQKSSVSCCESICFLISLLACSVTEKYPGCVPLGLIAIIFPRYQ